MPKPRGRVRFLSDDVVEDGKTVPGERSRLLLKCEEARSEHLLTIVVLALSTGSSMTV